MRRVLLLAGRETRLGLRSGSTWIFLAAFAFLAPFLVLVMGDFLASGRAEIRPLLDLLPWLLALLLPALTMRLVAEEERTGLLEVLLTAPFSEFEIVLGKVLGAIFLSTFALAATIPVPAVVFYLGTPDLGPVVTGYLGLVLLSAVVTSLGLAASARASSAVGAYVLGAVGAILLLTLDAEPILRLLPGAVREFLVAVAPRARYLSLARGTVSAGDVAVLLGWSGWFLGLAAVSLRARRGETPAETRRDRAAFSLLLGTAILLAAPLFFHLPLRYDATASRRYTVSEPTRVALAALPADAFLRVYLSREDLPSELAPLLRDIEDLLAEFRRVSGGRFQYEITDPRYDLRAQEETRRLGITPRSVSIVRGEAYQEAQIWMGMAAFSGGSVQAVPTIDPSRLEYQTVVLLRKLTGVDRPRVLFASEGDHSLFGDYALFREILDQTVEIRQAFLDGSETPLAEAKALILTSPSLVDTAVASWVEKGGGSLWILAGTTPGVPSMGWGEGEKNLARWGVALDAMTVLDASCEVVVIPKPGGERSAPVPVSMPTLLRVTKEGIVDHPANEGLSTLLLPWASPVRASDTPLAGASYTVLVRSSPRSELNPAPPPLDEAFDVPRDGISYSLGLLAEEIGPGRGRVLLLGSHLAFSLALLGDPNWLAPNLIAAENYTDYLVGGGSLAQLRGKISPEHPFRRPFSGREKGMLKWIGTLAGPLAIALFFGLSRALRRRGSR